ncbi:MAG: hypothetical protein H0W49_15995, partial [Nitrospirales bacterium]|nr:hypothetical protein [Nitrospirales bacterium]
MRKAHVKVLPLGAIVFVLVLLGGVFPSMAQAVGLTINFVGSGTGRVEANSPGTDTLNIFSSNTLDYDQNSSVTLTATPTGIGPSQSIFSSWAGCEQASGDQCTLVMDAAKAVTVTFNLVPVTPVPPVPPVQRTLTVTKAGAGSGTVTSVPGGISCGNDCTEGYANGTSVTLTAVAAAGSSFAGWSGGGCAGTGTCPVTMTAAQAVTATFTTVQRTLTVTKAGAGSGTVTSVPGGISCGNDCT